MLKHNMLVMEISHVVPTMLGMPMKIALNGSAVITVDMNGKVDTKNLIFGPKTVTISGNLKPRYFQAFFIQLSIKKYLVLRRKYLTTFDPSAFANQNLTGKGEETIHEPIKVLPL